MLWYFIEADLSKKNHQKNHQKNQKTGVKKSFGLYDFSHVVIGLPSKLYHLKYFTHVYNGLGNFIEKSTALYPCVKLP